MEVGAITSGVHLASGGKQGGTENYGAPTAQQETSNYDPSVLDNLLIKAQQLQENSAIGKGKGKGKGPCFTCGQLGHQAWQCPNKQQQGGGGGKGLINMTKDYQQRPPRNCYHCGKPGHIADYCYHNPNAMKARAKEKEKEKEL